MVSLAGSCSEFENIAAQETQEQSLKRNSSEIREITPKEAVDHTQDGGFSYTIWAMQKRDTVLGAEIDVMVKNAEEAVDLNFLQAKKLR